MYPTQGCVFCGKTLRPGISRGAFLWERFPRFSTVSVMKSFIQLLVLLAVTLPHTSFAEVDDQVSELTRAYSSIKQGQPPLLEDQPIRILSSVDNDRLTAEIYAIKKVAFHTLVDRLTKPSDWCRFITLHVNIKACIYHTKPVTGLSFYAGRKFYEPAEDAYELRYRFAITEKTDNYLKLQLSAKDGPFGTSDYLIVLEALKIKDDVILHMSLAYNSSFSSRLGTRVYLSTIGSDKVGFSQIKNEDSELEYIKGVEGIIERNVMRYFLALSVFLDHQNDNQMPAAWFEAIEKYATQLHELERAEYLEAKRREFAQQAEMQQRVNRGSPALESLFDDE